MTIHPVRTLVVYHSYRIYDDEGNRVLNPLFDDNSRMLLNLKDETDYKHRQAIAECTDLVHRALKGLPYSLTNVQLHLVVIPSSRKDQWSSGLCAVVNRLCRLDRRFVDAARALRRTKTIAKLATGGDRSLAVHLDSIDISETYRHTIRSKTIVLLDDITTTGNSLHAGALILQQAGAAITHPVAIGRTA